jgi:serine protease Do
MKKVVRIGLIIVILIPILAFSAELQEKNVMIIKGDDGPWLGVRIEDLSAKMLNNLGLENGIRVREVLENSPAQKVGIEEDDILISFNGKVLDDSDELVKMVKKSEVGDEVTIGYYRDGKKSKASIKLAEREQPNIMRWYGKDGKHKIIKPEKKAWLGVKTESLNDQLRDYFGAPNGLGVLVKEVIKESPAEKVGLKAGDVIIKVADRDIKNAKDLVRTINYYNPDEVVEVTVMREKKKKSFKVTLGETKGMANFQFYGFDDKMIEVPDVDVTLPYIEDIPDMDVIIEKEKIEDFENQMDAADKEKKVKKFRIETRGDET